MTDKRCYLVFGPQGSGKSTQAEYISEHLNLPFFDSGRELRAAVESDASWAGEVRELMKKGQLVPNKYLREIIESFMKNHDCSKGIVADGFPRNETQIELLEELIEENSWQVSVFYITLSDQTAQDRLAKRFTIVNGKKVVREDDQPAIVAKRLAVFKKETLPVIEYLGSKYTLYKVDGEPSREDVFKQIRGIIDEQN